MNSRNLMMCLALCAAGAPAIASPAPPPSPAEVQPAPQRTAATVDELAAYAEREQQADTQEQFHGGRGAYIEASTLVIVLLVVIIVLLVL